MFINNIAALTELCNSRHTQTPEPSQEMNCCPISIQTNCVNTPKLYTCRVKINIHAAVGSAREICENCWHTQRHARKGASALGENGTQTEARQSPAKPTTHSTQHRRKNIVERRPAIYTVLCYTHEGRGPQVTHETTTGVGCFSRFVFVTSRAAVAAAVR